MEYPFSSTTSAALTIKKPNRAAGPILRDTLVLCNRAAYPSSKDYLFPTTRSAGPIVMEYPLSSKRSAGLIIKSYLLKTIRAAGSIFKDTFIFMQQSGLPFFKGFIHFQLQERPGLFLRMASFFVTKRPTLLQRIYLLPTKGAAGSIFKDTFIFKQQSGLPFFKGFIYFQLQERPGLFLRMASFFVTKRPTLLQRIYLLPTKGAAGSIFKDTFIFKQQSGLPFFKGFIYFQLKGRPGLF